MVSTQLLKTNVTQIQFNSEEWEQIPKMNINFIRYFSALLNAHITENLAQQALRFKRSAPFIVTTKHVIC
ncbi:hypothetical protein BCT42_16540 [Vibrio lentus]|nr:hypothetical protein BCU45_10715 [Vibrio lentus]PMI66177.1 hypothetical protein BCU40_09900 [Vibrio lentus]PMJ59996.1 hypothetical protein BCU20_01060 [Vibrio lentus]PMN03785.1 hypothetical protein BCT42_16540 [Vibrio lentus]